MSGSERRARRARQRPRGATLARLCTVTATATLCLYLAPSARADTSAPELACGPPIIEVEGCQTTNTWVEAYTLGLTHSGQGRYVEAYACMLNANELAPRPLHINDELTILSVLAEATLQLPETRHKYSYTQPTIRALEAFSERNPDHATAFVEPLEKLRAVPNTPDVLDSIKAGASAVAADDVAAARQHYTEAYERSGAAGPDCRGAVLLTLAEFEQARSDSLLETPDVLDETTRKELQAQLENADARAEQLLGSADVISANLRVELEGTRRALARQIERLSEVTASANDKPANEAPTEDDPLAEPEDESLAEGEDESLAEDDAPAEESTPENDAPRDLERFTLEPPARRLALGLFTSGGVMLTGGAALVGAGHAQFRKVHGRIMRTAPPEYVVDNDSCPPGVEESNCRSQLTSALLLREAGVSALSFGAGELLTASIMFADDAKTRRRGWIGALSAGAAVTAGGAVLYSLAQVNRDRMLRGCDASGMGCLGEYPSMADAVELDAALLEKTLDSRILGAAGAALFGAGAGVLLSSALGLVTETGSTNRADRQVIKATPYFTGDSGGFTLRAAF